MKCYTWEYGQITEGIKVVQDQSLGTIVYLGAEGRGGGRYLEKVELYPKKPPKIVDGYIQKAHPVKITTNLERNPHYYMLAEPVSNTDSRVLVRIITRWIFSKGTHGRWETIKGAPIDLMVGRGAHGTELQRYATWRDGIVLLAPGDAVCIKPEGAYHLGVRSDVIECNENGIKHMPFRVYERLVEDNDQCKTYLEQTS